MDRLSVLKQKAQELLGTGKQVDQEIAKQPGSTPTEKLINLLESLNKETVTCDVKGIFTGGFTSKAGVQFWRVGIAGEDPVVMDITEGKFKDVPNFGDEVSVTQVTKVLHKISERTDFLASKKSKLKTKKGDILTIAMDILNGEEGWGLFSANLYAHTVGKNGMITDKGISLFLRMRSNEVGSDGKARFVTVFLANTEQLIMIFPLEEQSYVRSLLDKDDYDGIEAALAHIEWNPNLRLPGINIIIYGNLKVSTYISQGQERTGWQMWPTQIFNVDNIGTSLPTSAIAEEPDEDEPEEEISAIEEESKKEENSEEELSSEEPEESEDNDSEDSEPSSDSDDPALAFKQSIQQYIALNPEVKTIPLIEAIMKESGREKNEVVTTISQMTKDKVLEAKEGTFKVLKEL
jgi:hypothetical protein